MLTWLPKVLRSAGLNVVELPGWAGRGEDRIRPQGVVIHHTATGPNVSDAAVENLLVKGRSDLKGPLSQLGLRRDGTWVVVAAGRCNHNGYGLWGNDSIGVEAYNDGVGEPWPKAQVKAYEVGVAALCRYYAWGTERVKGHKETDPGRKIDPTFDMHQFRVNVAAAITTPQPPVPDPEPEPVIEENPGMELLFDKSNYRAWISDNGTIVEVSATAHVPFFCPPGQEWDGPLKQSWAMTAIVAKIEAARAS